MTDTDADRLIRRAMGEFLEMPGLRLTSRQAARLWGVDAVASERLLDRLARTGFLWRNAAGAYTLASFGF
jgi:hypothetical protein